ncbi:hypothetical protein PR048_027386 [Dryococelus australis]|uniref:Uncharacterized protein n=1 Tax=Dryococelus australis TaxID=614101 RepID=A0ABQ9GFP5_9NEOP|nr:hypothetical protein PR048_027386 [Dryococelus australis]
MCVRVQCGCQQATIVLLSDMARGHAPGRKSPDIPALRLGGALAELCPVVLHLAAGGLTTADVRGTLLHALQQGITSVLLLRGGQPFSQS